MNRSLMPNASCFSIAISIIMLIAATSTAQELNRPPENFQALFNGIDTTGWYGWATKNPEKLWAMSDEEQAQYKKKVARTSNNTGQCRAVFLLTTGTACT